MNISPEPEKSNFLLEEVITKLNVNKINEKNIKLIKTIATGGQGKIKYGFYKNLEVIIKVLNKSNIINLIQEISNMVKYKSVYIPKFLGIFENNKYYGLVIEYIDGLNLTKIISLEKQGKIFLSLIQKINYLIQLSSVIDYLNTNNLIHRDLKTDNLLVDKLGDLKLIDFGISLQGKKIWINPNSPYYSLTPSYMAPEIVHQNQNDFHILKINNEYKIIKNDNNKGKINPNSKEKWILITDKYDIWTFGIIMCQLLTRCKPWCRNEKESLSEMDIKVRLIKKLPYPINKFYPIKDCLSYRDELQDIIKACLNFEPEQRPPMKRIKEELLKIYSRLYNEKSLFEFYNQMKLIHIKNNKRCISALNKGKNNFGEELGFSKFRENRNIYEEYKKKEENGEEVKISLFENKILEKINEDNIKLKQDILIKKSIIFNDFRLNKDDI